MDLSWILPPAASINESIPRDTYLSMYKKVNLPSAQDLATLIRQAGKGAFLYSCGVSLTYRQFPLNPADWPLACFNVGGKFFMDVSLPFCMGWTTASCQDTTSLVTNQLRSRTGSKSLTTLTIGGGGGQGHPPILKYRTL